MVQAKPTRAKPHHKTLNEYNLEPLYPAAAAGLRKVGR